MANALVEIGQLQAGPAKGIVRGQIRRQIVNLSRTKAPLHVLTMPGRYPGFEQELIGELDGGGVKFDLAENRPEIVRELRGYVLPNSTIYFGDVLDIPRQPWNVIWLDFCAAFRSRYVSRVKKLLTPGHSQLLYVTHLMRDNNPGSTALRDVVNEYRRAFRGGRQVLGWRYGGAGSGAAPMITLGWAFGVPEALAPTISSVGVMSEAFGGKRSAPVKLLGQDTEVVAGTPLFDVVKGMTIESLRRNLGITTKRLSPEVRAVVRAPGYTLAKQQLYAAVRKEVGIPISPQLLAVSVHAILNP